MSVTDGAEGRAGLRQIAGFGSKIQDTVLLNVLREKNGVLHVRVEERALLAEEMNHFHRIASLPEEMAQIAVRADFLTYGFAQLHQRLWVVDDEIGVHLEGKPVNTVIASIFR